MSADVDPLEGLLAERAVRALIARTARAGDDGDSGAYAELFTDDAVVDTGRDRVEGRAALQAWATALGDGGTYRHFVTNVEITVEATDRARGEMDLLLLAAADGAWVLAGTMRFRDEYRSTPDGWRFSSRCIDVVRPPKAAR